MQRTRDHLNSDDNNACFVPERLIDVGIDSLRLVTRDDIRAVSAQRPQAQYCALSYCWGPHEDAKTQTKTTRRVLRHHLDGLEFDDLSPVIQDAVKTARNLDIPYLWVDSLCILQDDNSDWQRQCSQMSQIYGNALVTLIAADSKSCNEGFLNPKRRMLRFPYDLEGRTHTRGSFMMYFTDVVRGETFVDWSKLIRVLHRDLSSSRWARRGWTFQEEAMAGARIIFGNQGVYFGREEYWMRYLSKDGDAGSVQRKLTTSAQSKYELYSMWEDIILRYSSFGRSSFTEPTDVLPALSGLARVFGNKLQVDGHDYVAGYWKDSLHSSMLWKYVTFSWMKPSLNEIIRRHEQEPYLVPTWSSLTRGGIRSVLSNETRGLRSEITIIDVYKQLAGENVYGAIRNACITLEGYVLDLASLSWSQSSGKLVASSDNHGEEVRLEGRFSEQNMAIAILCKKGTCIPEESGACCRYGMDPDIQVELGDLGNSAPRADTRAAFDLFLSRVTLLLLASGGERRDDARYSRRYGDDVVKTVGYGLMLVPWEGASARSFLRVGTFRPQTGPFDRTILPCLKKLMKKEKIKLF